MMAVPPSAHRTETIHIVTDAAEGDCIEADCTDDTAACARSAARSESIRDDSVQVFDLLAFNPIFFLDRFNVIFVVSAAGGVFSAVVSADSAGIRAVERLSISCARTTVNAGIVNTNTIIAVTILEFHLVRIMRISAMAA